VSGVRPCRVAVIDAQTVYNLIGVVAKYTGILQVGRVAYV